MLKISYTTPFVTKTIVDNLNLVLEHKSPNQPLVIVCIGSDRSTGDSLGPLVGSKLVNLNIKDAAVFGTLDNPVHAVNLAKTIEHINTLCINPFIIAIDACLGKLQNVGNINVGVGSIKPGAGVNKDLPAIGDVFITGTVNVGGFMEYMVLQNTRLSLVMNMANIIARALHLYIIKNCSKTVNIS